MQCGSVKENQVRLLFACALLGTVAIFAESSYVSADPGSSVLIEEVLGLLDNLLLELCYDEGQRPNPLLWFKQLGSHRCP